MRVHGQILVVNDVIAMLNAKIARDKACERNTNRHKYARRVCELDVIEQLLQMCTLGAWWVLSSWVANKDNGMVSKSAIYTNLHLMFSS